MLGMLGYTIEGLTFEERVALVLKALVAMKKREKNEQSPIFLGQNIDIDIKESYEVFNIEELLSKSRNYPSSTFVIVRFHLHNKDESYSLKGEGWVGVKVEIVDGEVRFTPLWGYDIITNQNTRRAAAKIATDGKEIPAGLDNGKEIYEALNLATNTALDSLVKDLQEVHNIIIGNQKSITKEGSS